MIIGQSRRMRILEMLIENDLCLVDSRLSSHLGIQMDMVKSHFDMKFGPLWIERAEHTLDVNPLSEAPGEEDLHNQRPEENKQSILSGKSFEEL